LSQPALLDAAARKLHENQIDFDFVPADLFRDPEAFALDKKLHINGESFSALVVPSFEHITEAVLSFTEQALEKGFPVFFADKMPVVAGIKGKCRPSGTVVPLAGIPNALRNAGACDIKLSSPFTSLRYYRYRHENEIYIFSNESIGETFTGVITVPTEGDACIYDAYDNVLRPLSFRGIPGGTELTLTVRPFEPVIVVFGDKGESLTPGLSTDGTGLELKSWDVSICESKEYPSFHDAFKAEGLASIGDRFPDFSGFIRYKTSFETSGSSAAVLEIEDAYEGVEVWCNGKYIGMKIAPRFIFDLTDAISEGKNNIRIEAATNLERKTDKMLGQTFSLYQRSTALIPTGIVGKVRLITQ
jgi:hypothetical protein